MFTEKKAGGGKGTEENKAHSKLVFFSLQFRTERDQRNLFSFICIRGLFLICRFLSLMVAPQFFFFALLQMLLNLFSSEDNPFLDVFPFTIRTYGTLSLVLCSYSALAVTVLEYLLLIPPYPVEGSYF